MAYGTRDDLNLDDVRLAELTDSDQQKGVVNWTRVDVARNDAAGMIDGKLGGIYVVPLQPVPRIVVLWERNIARYFLYQRRETMEMPDSIKEDYERALRDLEAEAKDRPTLPCARSQAETPPAPGGGVLEDVPRRFGRDRDGLG